MSHIVDARVRADEFGSEIPQAYNNQTKGEIE